MKIPYHFILILNVVFLQLQCKTPKKEGYPIEQLEIPSIITFADSTEASKRIIYDDIDGFFNTISAIDMNIQMKRETQSKTRAMVLDEYISYLTKSTTDWTSDEKTIMSDIFLKVKMMCDTISPTLFPDDVTLIKIKTNHYGDDVYYTRGRNILIPENIFKVKDDIIERQLPVMLHEVFHILSRYDSDLRNESYKLIGFEKSQKPILIDDLVKSILLTNPDGVSTDYYINLDNGEVKTSVIPLITSKFSQFKKSIPSFFDYLQFDLFKVDLSKTDPVTESKPNGTTTLNIAETPSFFNQIKDNTQYIIHPDEIMADNFMLALQAYTKNEYKNFSPEGKKLVQDLIVVLRKK